MREIARALALGLVVLVLSSACTLRYSQTLVGEIYPVSSFPTTQQSDGFGIGLSGPPTITLGEPDAVSELLNVPCEIALAQSDYRSRWFAFYIALEYPRTETVTYCVK